MKESQIEKYLKEECHKINGICRKWVCPGRRGVPDRICIFPYSLIYFVECKAVNGKLSPLQQIEIDTLKLLGCNVTILTSKKAVDNFISQVNHLMATKYRNLHNSD